MNTEIDINADLGEGYGNDAALMPLLSSCSIACGGHYGDEETMTTAIQLAMENKVRIGAHPSFPDKDNFGRATMTITKDELSESVYHQLLRFYAVCEIEDAPIHHIKLHGALYNHAAIDAPTADAVVEAIVATRIRPKLYVPHNSILHKKAENLLPLIYEAFMDRRYTDKLNLVPRDMDGAVIKDREMAWGQLHKMVTRQQVDTIGGLTKSIVASTYCIHGDNPAAIDILSYIRKKMEEHKIQLQ